MHRLLQPVKYLAIFIMIFLFLGSSTLFFLQRLGKWPLKKRLTYNIAFWSRLGLRVIGIHVHIKGNKPPEDNYLVVCNHQSYLDILIHSVTRPSAFVTSLDIKRMPLIGQIVVLAGCLFVDRKSRENLPKEIEELTEGLKHDLDVTIFPEATSTDGSSVLRFRRPLYNAAIFSNKKILPMTIRYDRIDGRDVDVSTRDVICWYGDMAFVPHLWTLLGKKRIDVTLTFLDPVDPSTGDAALLAEKTHAMVSAAYRPY